MERYATLEDAEEVIQEAIKFAKEEYGVIIPRSMWKINGRLKRYEGWFKRYRDFHEAVSLDLAKYIFTEQLLLEHVKGVAKHEALHYCAWEQGKPFDDGSEYFESRLRKHRLPTNEKNSKREGVQKVYKGKYKHEIGKCTCCEDLRPMNLKGEWWCGKCRRNGAKSDHRLIRTGKFGYTDAEDYCYTS